MKTIVSKVERFYARQKPMTALALESGLFAMGLFFAQLAIVVFVFRIDESWFSILWKTASLAVVVGLMYFLKDYYHYKKDWTRRLTEGSDFERREPGRDIENP